MLTEDIKKRIQNLEKVEKRLEKDLANVAEGSLYSYKTGKTAVYYEKQDQQRLFLSRSKEKRIRELEKKEYYLKLKSALKKEIAALKRVLAIMEKADCAENVYLQIAPEKRHLIQPYLFADNDKILKQFLNRWEERRVDVSNYKTISGDYVRSKSELIIADRMTHYDVPYVYEPPTLMDDELEIWHPDFLALNKRTGESFYWEHFGMLNDSKYCDNMHYKLERYAQAGIFVGQKLIITSETATHPLNMEYVDRLIKRYLV